MADELNNLVTFQEPILKTPDKAADIKKNPRPKYGTGMRFIITKNKNNSWVDDLHAQEQLNQMDRVFH